MFNIIVWLLLLLFDTCSPRRVTEQDSYDADVDEARSPETIPVGVVAVYIYTCNAACIGV